MKVRSDAFARAFGTAFGAFLRERGMSFAAAANATGVSKELISRICSAERWSEDEPPPRPNAELLVRACIQLDFQFAYNGHVINARNVGRPPSRLRTVPQQLRFDFQRQFNLTDADGQVAVTVKRPPGRIEVSMAFAVSG